MGPSISGSVGGRAAKATGVLSQQGTKDPLGNKTPMSSKHGRQHYPDDESHNRILRFLVPVRPVPLRYLSWEELNRAEEDPKRAFDWLTSRRRNKSTTKSKKKPQQHDVPMVSTDIVVKPPEEKKRKLSPSQRSKRKEYWLRNGRYHQVSRQIFNDHNDHFVFVRDQHSIKEQMSLCHDLTYLTSFMRYTIDWVRNCDSRLNRRVIGRLIGRYQLACKRLDPLHICDVRGLHNAFGYALRYQARKTCTRI
jgi:hypothetical protein